MAPDPRGSPNDEDYIHHLEFFNQQLQMRIEEMEREKRKPKHNLARKTMALLLFWYLWIPLKLAAWSERNEV